MARIRTIKPEFWTDDLLGSLSREARLLFIGTWNMADDEGLLRWSAPFLKGALFPFDDDLSVKDVQKLMLEIEQAGIIFPYTGGRSQQALGYVVNFHKHQRINRPSPSRLPPPPIGDDRVCAMYAARDGGVCYLCALPFDDKWSDKYQNDFLASPDHVKPQARGGTDFPSNIKAAHLTCNKGRRDRTADEYREVLRSGKTAAQQRYPERFANFSLMDSLNGSVPEKEEDQELGTGTKELDLGPSERACADAQPRPTKVPKPKPGTRIPDDWRPSNAGRAFAADRGLDPDSTADAFIDWWTAATGNNAVKRDWDAAFRTWCRRAVESGPVGVGKARPVHAPRGNDPFFEQLADIASRDND